LLLGWEEFFDNQRTLANREAKEKKVAKDQRVKERKNRLIVALQGGN